MGNQSTRRRPDDYLRQQRLYEPMTALCIILFIGLLARHHLRSWVDGKDAAKDPAEAKPTPAPAEAV